MSARRSATRSSRASRSTRLDALRARAESAEEALRAIRGGEVDALVIGDAGDEKVFTLTGAERPYRAFYEGMLDGAAMLSPDGTVLSCNTRLAEMAGMPQEQLIGTSLLDLVIRDDAAALGASLRKSTSGALLEVSFRQPDKPSLPVLLTISGTDQETPPVLAAIARDLSDRKRAEKELRRAHDELEERVRTRTAELERKTALLELLQDVSITPRSEDTTEDVLAIALERICSFLRWPVAHAVILAEDGSDKLISSAIWHLDDPKARFDGFVSAAETVAFDLHTQLFGRSLAAGNPIWTADATRDSRFPLSDAVARAGLRSAFVLPVRVGSTIGAALMFFSADAERLDVSELRAMAIASARIGRVIERNRAELKFRGLLESAPDAMVIIDRDGIITLVNSQAQSLFGYRRDELVGRHVELLVPDRARAGHPDLRGRFFADPVPRTMAPNARVVARRKDGVEVPVEISLSPLRTEEGLLASAAIRDVTDRRALEQMRKDVVSMLSHDMKNPLSVVLGLADMLRRDVLETEEERRGAMDQIEVAARRTLTMAVNFVDAGLIESGALKLDCEPTSLDEIVRDVAKEQRALARVRQVRVEELHENVPNLLVDRNKLARVITNLVANAIMFSPPASTVRIRTAHREREVTLSVEDHGPGIPAADRESLFRRFNPLAGRSTKNGSGLGLFIVRTFVEAHGGRIGVTCPSEGGSVFTVTLPAPEVAPASAAAEPALSTEQP